jgi:uncharacterized protein (TIGR02996 family)
VPGLIHTAGDALLRDVLREPGADGLRLVYADWLEEHGGDPARAEFTRVQVELARLLAEPCWYDGKPWPNSPPARCVLPAACAKCAAVGRLFPRARELLGPHWFAWCGGLPGLSYPSSEYPAAPVRRLCVDGRVWRIEFRRGFVDEVRLPCADFLTHAAALFAAHPVTRVELGDREPLPTAKGTFSWWARKDDVVWPEPGYQYEVPASLYAFLPRGSSWEDAADYHAYAGEAAARDALSAAAVSLGRQWAGLPALGG